MTSWFSEFTSKAEAMLMKLDQDAALALQGQDRLLSRPRIDDSEQVKLTSSDVRNNDSIALGSNDTFDNDTFAVVDEQTLETDHHQQEVQLSNYQCELTEQSENSQSLNFDDRQVVETSDNHSLDKEESSDIRFLSNQPEHEPTKQFLSPKQTPSGRKFTVRSSKVGSSAFDLAKRSNNKPTLSDIGPEIHPNHSHEHLPPLRQLEANHIRASINRSLQDYVTRSVPIIDTTKVNLMTEQNSELNPRTSYFDNCPIVIGDSEKSYSSQLISPSSHSIQVSEDITIGDSSSVTACILRQTISQKKSPFYIHKVLNSLSGSDDVNGSLLSDQTRIKLRRVQLRAASYARRLNYYFRVYPKLKYLILCYLLIMQLLVVYVLFFYQTTSSSTELLSQVRQQQQELSRTGLLNEVNPVASEEGKIVTN